MLKNRCATCGWEFEETSTQIWRRVRKDHHPICSSCQRIARAEEAAEKRHCRKNRTGKDCLQVQLEEAKRKFGVLSISFLQRKLKVTFEEAEKLMEKING